MIKEYHRPDSLQAALELLSRSTPPTFPLAGGTILTQPGKDEIAVVDLQSLGLDAIQMKGNTLELGAAATLQQLLDAVESPLTLRRVVQLEATYNLRQVASVAGTLVACDGRSPFAAVMLAMDARLAIQPGDGHVDLGEMLLQRPAGLRGKLITTVAIPSNVRVAYHGVSRTPADRPIVCAAVALWPSGRTRVTLGGYGPAPLMVLDGPEASGWEAAVKNAYASAGDAWASAQYRQETALTLAQRALADVQRSDG
jgi:CO/xanthine dehydrogenase FAD-binding subunit